ncbi:hypothetical protein C8R46DRAFT_1042082 [Mycena filopes]|nr:hypothetical protein C8R46DRAFT_1042082 [Mycena filopes]
MAPDGCSALECPVLRVFSPHLSDNVDLDICLSLLTAAPAVACFTPSGTIFDEDCVMTLLQRLPLLTTLDLSCTEGSLFKLYCQDMGREELETRRMVWLHDKDIKYVGRKLVRIPTGDGLISDDRILPSLLFYWFGTKQTEAQLSTSHPAPPLLGVMLPSPTNNDSLALNKARSDISAVFPNEVLRLILEQLCGPPRDYHDIHENMNSRENILQLSQLFKELCLSTPEMWASIDVHNRIPKGSWARPEPILSELLEDLELHIERAKNRLLYVAFSIPITTAAGDPGRILFERVLRETHRLDSICFSGEDTCEYSALCPHTVFDKWTVLRDAPLLRVVCVEGPGAGRRCPTPHAVVPVRLPRLHSLKCMFPVKLILTDTIPIDAPTVPTNAVLDLPHLTSLGIDCQSSDLWAKVLVSCRALERLLYGSNNSLDHLFPSPLTIPTLRSLRIYRTSCIPPVSAPNLEELVVWDPHNGLTAAAFSRIVGSTSGVLALRTLDLLLNPTLNEDFDVILDRCPVLRVLRLCSNSRCELRTSTYRTLRYRIHTSYLRLGQNRFAGVEFSHPPPGNTWALSARLEFEALCKLGIVINDCEIRVYPLVFRVEVLGCRKPFPTDLFSSGIDRFKSLNRFNDSLIAAQPYELIHLISVPSVFTVILAFHNREDALRAVREGVKQGGRIRKAIQFRPIWDDDAGTFI